MDIGSCSSAQPTPPPNLAFLLCSFNPAIRSHFLVNNISPSLMFTPSKQSVAVIRPEGIMNSVNYIFFPCVSKQMAKFSNSFIIWNYIGRAFSFAVWELHEWQTFCTSTLWTKLTPWLTPVSQFPTHQHYKNIHFLPKSSKVNCFYPKKNLCCNSGIVYFKNNLHQPLWIR